MSECKMRVCVINVPVLHLQTYLRVLLCLPLVLRAYLASPTFYFPESPLSSSGGLPAVFGLRLRTAGSDLRGFKSSPTDSWLGFVTDRAHFFFFFLSPPGAALLTLCQPC